jgi:hypothetical protein
MNDPQQADHPVLSGFQRLRQYFRRGRSGEESRMQSSQLTQTSSSSSGLLPLTSSWEAVLLVVLVGAMLLALAYGLYALVQPSAFKSFDIVAGLVIEDEATDTWSIHGRVLRDNVPAPGLTVWAMMKDQKGNRHSPPAAKTNAEGAYAITRFPMKIGPNPVTEVTVRTWDPAAQGPSDWFGGAQGATGEEVLVIGQGSLRRVKFSNWGLFVPASIFLASMGVAFLGRGTRWAYKLAMGFAFLLTGVMIIAISAGLSYVHTTGEKNEVLSLGFASLFRGQYVEQAEPEWLFSLTAPHGLPNSAPKAPSKLGTSPDAKAKAAATAATSGGEAALEPQPPGLLSPANVGTTALGAKAGSPERLDPPLVRGFGAPLWVLLLAVLGVGLRTMSIIVNEISHEPDFHDQQGVRGRIELIVRHQFFMLFAPLGAIFVYQFLVMAESANQPSTVALVSLGAGLTLTTLLERALATASQYAEGPSAPEGPPHIRTAAVEETFTAKAALIRQEAVREEPAPGAGAAGAVGGAPPSPARRSTMPAGEDDRPRTTPASVSGGTNGTP